MGNQNQKNTGTVALIVLLLLVAVVALILATYAWAKYTETISDVTATAQVARWQVSAGGQAATWTQTFTSVVTDKLAPGTEGKIPVVISATGSEVDVHYDVYITNIVNKPTNLKFYGSTSAGVVDKSTVTVPVGAFNAGDKLISSGTIAVNGANVTQNIFWEWPFTTGEGAAVATNDQIDTTEGKAAATMTVTYKVVFTQVQPTNS